MFRHLFASSHFVLLGSNNVPSLHLNPTRLAPYHNGPTGILLRTDLPTSHYHLKKLISSQYSWNMSQPFFQKRLLKKHIRGGEAAAASIEKSTTEDANSLRIANIFTEKQRQSWSINRSLLCLKRLIWTDLQRQKTKIQNFQLRLALNVFWEQYLSSEMPLKMRLIEMVYLTLKWILPIHPRLVQSAGF